jgi:dienelactone hydrolase
MTRPGGRLIPGIAAAICSAGLAFAATAKMDVQLAQAAPTAPPAAAGLPAPQVISYSSNGVQLKAFLFVPKGPGPFPAVLWNHGSEADPSPERPVAGFWVGQGAVYFKPVRSGQGGNPGAYIVDQEKAILAAVHSKKITVAAGEAQIIALHQKANDDVVAALQWLVAQPFVDKSRVAVGGGSYGGIQTLLTAQKNVKQKLGIKCFVAMSPAAESWNASWSTFLTGAVKTITTPIFLLQAKNDYNLGPSTTLGPLVDAIGFPSRHMIFPAHASKTGDPNDANAGHGEFFTDPAAWGADALAYLQDCKVLAGPTGATL